MLLAGADLLVRDMTLLVDSVANSTDSEDSTNAHETSRSDEELLKARETSNLAGRRSGRRKLLTLNDVDTEEALGHNSLVNTGDKNVELLTLDGSEGDLGLRRALVVVAVAHADLTTAVFTCKVNLDLGGKVSFDIAGGEGDPVVVTFDLVPVTLTHVIRARSVDPIGVSGNTKVIVGQIADTGGKLASGVIHGSLLVHLEHEGTMSASESSDEDPVVSMRI